ncbi:MAG: DUF5684 domain-containing protein [Phycisphaerae bacterium]|nr:DUF5684 domain-containing protein [Phycisphaerae bacterium]
MIRLNCGNCGQKIKTDDKYAGKRVHCPKCKTLLQVPQAEGRISPGQSAIIRFRCPNCDQKIGVSPDYAGKVVRCAKCKHRLRVPQPPGKPAQPQAPEGLAALKVGQELPTADEGSMRGLGDMEDLLQLEAAAPSLEDPLQLSPLEEPSADSRAEDYASQFPTRQSYQADGEKEKKKKKLVVPIVIGAVFIVALVIGYVAVNSFMSSFTSSLDTIDESQEIANYDEAKQFTEDYIALLADGDVNAAEGLLSPEVKAETNKEQIERLAKLVGKKEIVQLQEGPTHFEEGLAGNLYYIWYTLSYGEDMQVFIACVRESNTGFTVDGVVVQEPFGQVAVIGQQSYEELAQKAVMGELSKYKGIGALVAKSFCGIMVVFLIIALIQIISMWVIFEKAEQPGWAAIVPYYNMWVLAEVGDKPGWMGLGACLAGTITAVVSNTIPVVGCCAIPVGLIAQIVLCIMISLGVANRFGRSVLFGIGLSFLPFIFYPILAFSRD